MPLLWIDDPKVLMSTDLDDWNPVCGTIESKINALTKLILIASALFSIKKKDTKTFLRSVIAVGVVMILYVVFDAKNITSGFGQSAVPATTPPPVIARTAGVGSTHNPLGNWLPPVTSTNTPAISAQVQPDVDAILTQGVPSDDAFGNRSLTRPFYKTPEDNDNFKNFLYADGLENTFKQGSVYSHLSCPYSMGVAPGNTFGTGGSK